MINPLCLPTVAQDWVSRLRDRPQESTAVQPAMAADAWTGVSRSPSIEQAIDRASGTRAVPGNKVDLLFKDQYLPTLWESLRSARQSILVSALKIDDTQYGRQTAEILAERARAGVPVRVLLDQFNSRGGTGRDSIALMREAGVQVHLLDRPLGRTVMEIQHRKLTLVDGQVAFVGGQNLDWAGARAEDATLRVQGPVLRQLHDLALQGWREAGAPALPDPPAPHPAPVGQTVLRPLITDPCRQPFREALLTAIDNAKQQIYLNQVFFSDREVIEHLGRAARRGVKVDLIIPQKSYQEPINAVNRLDLPGMLRAGIRVHLNPSETHMKAVTIDGTWGVIGSTNLDDRALNDNYELSLAISNPETVREMDTRLMLPTLLSAQRAQPHSLQVPNQSLWGALKDRVISRLRVFI